jgi:hypothetical protein
MAFNKDQSPEALGKGQKAPRDLFSSMRQGVLRTIAPTRGLFRTMRQGSVSKPYPENAPSVNRRMKQGG